MRQRLDALGRRLGGTYRVLVDDNDHVDRAAAVRAGIAFYGKNTMAITRQHGSWVVLGVLVTDAEIELSPPLELDCGQCRLCIDACPTGALDDPGVLDSTKRLSYWSHSPAAVPDGYRDEMGDGVYGCDICQEVCPWNRGVEKRRRGSESPDARGTVRLADWLARDGNELVAEFDLLDVPRNDGRWLHRNALIVAGNAGTAALRPDVERYSASSDPVLSEAAGWALERMAGPRRVTTSLDSERLALLVHEVRSPVAALSAIAETLAEGRLDGEARRSLIRLVTLACRGIERIVADVAIASIRLESIDPVGLVRDAGAAARLRGADVELTTEPDSPLVDAHPPRLRQALDNLIGNALLHGGGQPVAVVVHADTMLRIEISDTGPGIPPDELERIFEPRVRLDPASSEGSGLGLTLARAIAEGHGGSLSVTSSPGVGVTFTLALPLPGV